MLDMEKQQKIKQIKIKTQTLCNKHVYSGQALKMNHLTLIYMCIYSINKSSIEFPVCIPDDSRECLLIATKQDLEDMIEEFSVRLQAVCGDEHTLIEAINAATTQEQLDAVVDERT